MCLEVFEKLYHLKVVPSVDLHTSRKIKLTKYSGDWQLPYNHNLNRYLDKQSYRQWTEVFEHYHFSLYISYKTTLSWHQFLSDFNYCVWTKAELNVVLPYYFDIILYDKHFENRQVKHKTKFILPKMQYKDITFVDKLLRPVFKGALFAKILNFCYP